MKALKYLAVVGGALALVMAGRAEGGKKATLPFVVYGPSQSGMPYIPSGWMGNHEGVGYAGDCTTGLREGSKQCLKLEYKAADQWGGIVWQDPANDWECTKPGGYDLTGAKKLTLWARGEAGGEKVTFFCGGKKNDSAYSNTAGGESVVELTKDWKQYSIDLSGKDLSRIKNGFGWSVGGQGKPVTFYVVDIQYE